MQSFKVYLKNPRRAVSGVMMATARIWPSRLYVSILYRMLFNKKLNIDTPITFNEKLNWQKFYNQSPQYTLMADKYAVKQFVAERIGSEYVVENYVVVNKWEDINFESLPKQFVIKCTHDSGGAFVCRDKSLFDYDTARAKVTNNLKQSWYWTYREWPYKNIKPRIIVDRLLDDHTGKELRDYKWWCFNGKPTFMYITIKGENVYENFYDMNFQPVAIDHGFPRHQPEFERPANFEKMKVLAEKLSEGIPFVRVDFFDVEGRIYFGEFTFYDWGGMRPFNGDWDAKLGELIILPNN